MLGHEVPAPRDQKKLLQVVDRFLLENLFKSVVAAEVLFDLILPRIGGARMSRCPDSPARNAPLGVRPRGDLTNHGLAGLRVVARDSDRLNVVRQTISSGAMRAGRGGARDGLLVNQPERRQGMFRFRKFRKSRLIWQPAPTSTKGDELSA